MTRWETKGSCHSPSALPWPRNPKAYSERPGDRFLIYLGQELEKGERLVKNRLWHPSLSPPQLCTNLLYPSVPELTARDASVPPCHSEPSPFPFIKYRTTVKYALSKHHKGGPVPFLFQRPLSAGALPHEALQGPQPMVRLRAPSLPSGYTQVQQHHASSCMWGPWLAGPLRLCPI